MDYQLKSISSAGIPEALAKVELYRYLNEPEESESICRDILAVDPKQQLALRLLGLSITDQFTRRRRRPLPRSRRNFPEAFRRLRALLLHGHPLRAPRQSPTLRRAISAHASAAFRASPKLFRRSRKNPPRWKRRLHPSLEPLRPPPAISQLRLGRATGLLRRRRHSPH